MILMQDKHCISYILESIMYMAAGEMLGRWGGLGGGGSARHKKFLA